MVSISSYWKEVSLEVEKIDTVLEMNGLPSFRAGKRKAHGVLVIRSWLLTAKVDRIKTLQLTWKI